LLCSNWRDLQPEPTAHLAQVARRLGSRRSKCIWEASTANAKRNAETGNNWPRRSLSALYRIWRRSCLVRLGTGRSLAASDGLPAAPARSANSIHPNVQPVFVPMVFSSTDLDGAKNRLGTKSRVSSEGCWWCARCANLIPWQVNQVSEGASPEWVARRVVSYGVHPMPFRYGRGGRRGPEHDRYDSHRAPSVPCLESCVVRVLSPAAARVRMRRQPGLSDSGRAIHSSRHP
jgi:hypothetical protein